MTDSQSLTQPVGTLGEPGIIEKPIIDDCPPKDLPTNGHPHQVDFGLLTINESEGLAVRQAFQGCWSRGGTMVGNKGSYVWGETKGFLFVHASTRDWKGPIPTIEMIRELSRLFSPQYLLVLGTAGGIKKTSQAIGAAGAVRI